MRSEELTTTLFIKCKNKYNNEEYQKLSEISKDKNVYFSIFRNDHTF